MAAHSSVTLSRRVAMKRRTFLGAVAASSAAAALPDHSVEAREPVVAKPTTITLLGTGTPAPSLERHRTREAWAITR
jgi:hypothetical protein